MKILGREPALWLAAFAAVINLAVGFGLPMSDTQVSLINAALAAAVALVGAIMVKPFQVPILVGAVNAALSVGIAFGLHLSSGTMGAVDAVIIAVMAVVLRQAVTPTTNTAPAVRRW